MKNLKKGFTLIELLVVVAIIGILASVVLGSLSSARDKGNDAAIKSNLAGIRNQAEIYFAEKGNYGVGYEYSSTGVCEGAPVNIFDDPLIKQAFDAAKSLSGASSSSQCIVQGLANKWAVIVPLKNNSEGWCVDSGGISKQVPLSNISGSDSDCSL